jgi:hypothetical protein
LIHPRHPHPKGPAPRPSLLKRILSVIALYLVELFLPVILAVAILYWLAGALKLWSLPLIWALVSFGALAIVLSAGLVFVIEAYVTGRTPKAKDPKQFLRQKRMRLVRMALGGVIIPLGVILAANFIQVSAAETAMALYVRVASSSYQSTPAATIGDTVLNTHNPAIRVQGIRALQLARTTQARDQLFRILAKDPNALADGTEYAALVKAVASYGTDARPKLFNIFSQADPAGSQLANGPAGEWYNRYFSLPVEALKADIKSTEGDAAEAKLARVDAAALTLKTALDDLQPAGETNTSYSVQDFVLSVFLSIDIKQDQELLAFAKTTAANSAYSERVRGQALRLIAAQGGKEALTSIYPFLQNSSEAIQGYALQAILSVEDQPVK